MIAARKLHLSIQPSRSLSRSPSWLSAALCWRHGKVQTQAFAAANAIANAKLSAARGARRRRVHFVECLMRKSLTLRTVLLPSPGPRDPPNRSDCQPARQSVSQKPTLSQLTLQTYSV